MRASASGLPKASQVAGHIQRAAIPGNIAAEGIIGLPVVKDGAHLAVRVRKLADRCGRHKNSGALLLLFIIANLLSEAILPVKGFP